MRKSPARLEFLHHFFRWKSSSISGGYEKAARHSREPLEACGVEYASQTVAAAAEPAETSAEAGPGTAGHDAPAQPTADEHLESRTREMLPKAIQNVMSEIEYHEVEAQKHLQQAAELRKEPRDSLRFLRQSIGGGNGSIAYPTP